MDFSFISFLIGIVLGAVSSVLVGVQTLANALFDVLFLQKTWNRKELDRMGINYSEAEFMKRLKDGEHDVCKTFILSGINPNAKDEAKWSALHFAAMFAVPNMVSDLLKRGALLEYRNLGYTPLISAISAGNPGTAQILLVKGANVNAVDEDAHTPLITAVRLNREDYMKCVSLLLKHGADTSVRDKTGRDAVAYAKEMHRDDAKEMLESEIKTLSDTNRAVMSKNPSRG